MGERAGYPKQSLVRKVSMILSFPFDSGRFFLCRRLFSAVAAFGICREGGGRSIWNCSPRARFFPHTFVFVLLLAHWVSSVYLSWLQSVARLFPSFATELRTEKTKARQNLPKKVRLTKCSKWQQQFYDYRFIKRFLLLLLLSICLKQTIWQRLTEWIPKLFWHTHRYTDP